MSLILIKFFKICEDTNYQKYVKNAKRHDICSDCFEYGNRVRVRQTCIDCGRSFDITNNQYDFYSSKGLDVPKRCNSCRDAKKRRSYSSTQSYSSPHSGRNNSSSNSSSRSSGSFCFIATAVCDYLGKPDDCAELTTLRNYRDTWLRNQPEWQLVIADYYNKAPFIVSKLKLSDQYEDYCQMLWDDYIQQCLQLIEDGAYKQCQLLYQKMVKHLWQLFQVKEDF